MPFFLFTVSTSSFRNSNYLFHLPFESGCCHYLVADPVVTNREGYECPPPTTAHYMALRKPGICVKLSLRQLAFTGTLETL